MIPYRIRIGVTGHRKELIPHMKVILEGVHSALDAQGARTATAQEPSIINLFSSPSPRSFRRGRTPIVYTLLTPLAEGADRIVADAIAPLEGAIIIPVLPMPQADYEATFGSPDLVEDFQRRLGRYSSAEHVPGASADPDVAFPAVGRYVVEKCDLLIAIWNGEPGATGGTAEVVDHARSIGRPTVIIDPKTGSVVEWFRGKGIHCPGFDRVEMINAQELTGEEMALGEQDLFGDVRPLLSSAHDARVERLKVHLLPLYARCDLIARRYKRLFIRVGRGAYLLSTLAVLAVTIGLLYPQVAHAAYAVEALLLGAILAAVLWGQNVRVHRRWLQNRFVAERCRTAVIFYLLGLEPSEIELFEEVGQEPEDRWVIRAFQEGWNKLKAATGTMSPPSLSDTSDLAGLQGFVMNGIIAGQKKYHHKKHERNKSKSHRLETLGHGIFAMAIIAALLHLLLPTGTMMYRPRALETSLTVLAILLPIIAASVEGLRKLREYSRVALSSLRMEGELGRCAARIDATTSRKDFEERFRELDRAMMRESQEWLALMITNELEPVT